ncbi:lipopolysaccharide biosynthesis protein [Aureimonas populi]|uniref:Lipopolysaccharide biosynthesis protein n=1 Tax=Aureimonas populi TaxID=1701758 RepID=A0ABW5CKV0_9HYPH|nr:lipopolysaccharide biosynthesis protein [Aureimonas populi]
MGRAAVWRERFKGEIRTLGHFAKLAGGAAGRLVISLAYFVSLANTLSVADFGLFATASAIGIVLSRVAGFGFVSPLYRIATGKPRLVGAYTGTLLVAFLLSAPVVAALSALFFALFFAGQMAALAFAAVIVAEVACWRALEVVCIVNNGLGRFGRGAAIVILGTALRALAAIAFASASDGSLLSWSLAYLGANALAALLSIALWYPRRRLRFSRGHAFARWRDSLAVMASEIAFYVQSELDKLLVLAVGGPQAAGLYAILMRLIDLTALPVRAFNTLVVQKLMRAPRWLASWRRRIGIEAAIAAASVAGLGALGLVLHVQPAALGRNVADAAPFVLLALLVPAFRNLVEYQGEMLYARGLTGLRVAILLMVGALKAGLLWLLLATQEDAQAQILGLNAVFAALWLASTLASYGALARLDRPFRPARPASG